MAHDDALHIAATQAFINANPTTIVINRPVKTSDGAGGTLTSSVTVLDAQVMRLVALNLRTAAEARVTADGQTVTPMFALIALPSQDVQVGDQFTDDGKLFEVVYVQNRPEWRKRAEVFEHAS